MRLQIYRENLQDQLRVHEAADFLCYVRGIGGILSPAPLGQALSDADVHIAQVEPPTLSKEMQTILLERVRPYTADGTPHPYPHPGATDLYRRTEAGIQPITNNPIPGTLPPTISDRLTIETYLTDFVHWKGTLPQADEFDARLVKSEMHLPFNTTALAVTRDGYFVHPERTAHRASHKGVLCFLNGYRLDRDVPANTLKCHAEILEDGTSRGLIAQSNGAISTQLNIPEQEIRTNQLLGLSSSEPSMQDYGYHSLHVATLALTQQQVMESANQLYGHDTHSRYRRFGPEHFTPASLEGMRRFAEKGAERMAMTQVPLVWASIAALHGKRALRGLGLQLRV